MTGWRNTPVLVTGAAGFIGANLARRLSDLGARVHALVSPSSSLWRITDVSPELVIHRVDITDRAGVDHTVRAAAPEVVFHLAAQGAARHDVDASQLFRTNVLGTLNLLAATQPLPAARVVHVGGSSEYGPRPTPLRETDRLEPVTAYGASKAAATIACQQFARTHQRSIVIVRPFSVYGPWEALSRLIPTATLAALERRTLALTPPGYRRDLIHVHDVVDACLLAATREIEPGEILNVGTGQQWSNEDVVRMIERASGCRIDVRVGEYPPRRSDTGHWVADVAKTDRLLGWRAGRTLETGLQEAVSWWSGQFRRNYVLD